MLYRLLDNQTGVLLNRKPLRVEGELVLSFPQGADKMTVSIESDGVQYYRELRGKLCRIDTAKLNGEVRVALLDTAKGHTQKRWVCEELFVEHTEHATWVYPNDNLSQEMIRLRLENEGMRKRIGTLEKKIDALNGQIDHLIAGYDIT